MPTWAKCTEDEEIVHLVDSNVLFVNLDNVRFMMERPGGGATLHFSGLPDEAAIHVLESPAEIFAISRANKL
jgi:hypothetical protein